jgi:preprotein translocase subunit SecY
MLDTIRNAWRIADLRKKILYTLFIILIFRIGAAIPVPFMNTEALTQMATDANAGLMGYIDILTGGAFSQATLFAMSISPYITSSIIIQLLTVAIPALEAMSKEGDEGRKKLAKISRYATIGLALLQSTAYYIMNRNLRTVKYTAGFDGWFSAVVIVLSFTAGAMLIVWLGESVDKHGMGNGISMILFAGIISRGPSTLNMMVSMWRSALAGATQYFFYVPGIIVLFLFVISAIVHMTNAERRIPVQYAKRVVGRKMYGGQASYIPVKVMMSGVMPIIFSSAILSIPSMIMGFGNIDPATGLGRFLNAFNYQSWVYAVLYLVLIIAFNYFYVAIQYNPIEIANNLRKNNGTIPGIRPGKPSSDFISKVIGKITLVGALFIAAVAVLPILLGAVAQIPIALGGTTVIIIVGVALDTVRQLESQMMMRHYKGFLE